MWDYLKKPTTIITQIFILVTCITALVMMGTDWLFVAVVFVAMQIAAALGTWLGNRLQKNQEKAAERLPLERRI
jgi:ABC-type bacteriocin/lantibiotic exporter with double-glycine peptidase domain